MIHARWHDIRRPFFAVALCMMPLLVSVAAGQSPLPGWHDAWRWFGVESGLPPAAIDMIRDRGTTFTITLPLEDDNETV